ncbi:PLD nuclease N-terminal domain-containing protein [Peribacillus butanolivorans]|uniref:PLD nuclease N-terminal domain-containing protein n=1 Tax=Peribacillus butanolivorans TaxID=421767 RepID=UPI0036DEDA65
MGNLLLGAATLSASDLQTILPVVVIHGILIIVAMVDLIRNWNVRKAKILWIIVMVMIQIVGPIVYFIFGRGKKDEKVISR